MLRELRQALCGGHAVHPSSKSWEASAAPLFGLAWVAQPAGQAATPPLPPSQLPSTPPPILCSEPLTRVVSLLDSKPAQGCSSSCSSSRADRCARRGPPAECTGCDPGLGVYVGGATWSLASLCACWLGGDLDLGDAVGCLNQEAVLWVCEHEHVRQAPCCLLHVIFLGVAFWIPFWKKQVIIIPYIVS